MAGPRKPLDVAPAPLRVYGQEAGTPGQGPAPIDVLLPGGDLLKQFLHPSITILDQLFRTLPEDTWYSPTVSPTQPVQFELGSFKVPPGVQLWIQNYDFAIFRQSGADPGDFVRCEDERFSGCLGFDLTLDGKRPASLSFQLDPQQAVVSRQQFEPPLTTFRGRRGPQTGAVPAQFNRSNVNSFASTANPGTSLLPARPGRIGPEVPNPFTYVARENVSVALSCVIFRPIPSPVVFIQGEIKGYLIQTNAADAFQNRLRPR